MATRNIVVIGASSGGIEALQTLMRGWRQDFAASIFVVLHTSRDSPGFLPSILERAGKLGVTHATDMQPIAVGHIYVAPPDHHLLLERGLMRVTRGPKENRFRPAIDPLFRSAAYAYGPRVVGVVLTGNLDDGSAGLLAIKRRGGIAVVQDPAEAMVPSMPRAALTRVEVDHCVKLSEMPALLARLASETAPDSSKQTMAEDMKFEVDIAAESEAIEAGVLKLGSPSQYACPECHGVLRQVKEPGVMRFRCHTGHAYTLDSLLAESYDATEHALWGAVRALDESALLLRAAGQYLRDSDQETVGELYLHKAQDAKRRAEFVRRALMEQSEGETVTAPASTEIAE